MVAASVPEALGAGGRTAVRAAAVADRLRRARVLCARTGFAGRSRRAVQCDRAAAAAVPGETRVRPTRGTAPFLLRRRPAAALLGCHALAPASSAPAGAVRNTARRFRARRAAGA